MKASLSALQLAVAFAGLVPVGAGLAGIVLGSAMAGDAPGLLAGGVSLDSHVRYLSGLLLGVGLAFWSLIPTIATAGPTFRLLTAIVVAGGLARLAGVAVHGAPSAPMLVGLAMELVVTPALCLWQARVASRPL